MKATEAIKAVCEYYNIEFEKLNEKRNIHEIKIATYVFRKEFRFTVENTAKAIGKSRQTVSAYMKEIKELQESNIVVKGQIKQIKKLIQSKLLK